MASWAILSVCYIYSFKPYSVARLYEIILFGKSVFKIHLMVSQTLPEKIGEGLVLSFEILSVPSYWDWLELRPPSVCCYCYLLGLPGFESGLYLSILTWILWRQLQEENAGRLKMSNQKEFFSVWSFFLTLSKSTKRVTCNFCIHLTLQCITTPLDCIYFHSWSVIMTFTAFKSATNKNQAKFWFQMFTVKFAVIWTLDKNAFLDQAK